MKNRPHAKVSILKKNNSQKLALTTFIGTVPLLGIICVVLFSEKSALSPEFVLISILVFTAFATALVVMLSGKFSSPG